MKIQLFSALLAVGLFAASPALAGGDHSTATVDTKASSIQWTGKKVSGQHQGTIALKGGTLELAHGKLEGGSFEMDMTSIACTDLTGEYKGKLEGHLGSPDFFDVGNHSTATFRITTVTAMAKDESGNNTKISGTLTIKGISKPLSFPANVTIKGDKVAAVADVNIDRTKYDIKYGSGQFFEGLGDKMIDDNFRLHIELGAK